LTIQKQRFDEVVVLISASNYNQTRTHKISVSRHAWTSKEVTGW